VGVRFYDVCLRTRDLHHMANRIAIFIVLALKFKARALFCGCELDLDRLGNVMSLEDGM
jgi:hypothetical protein